MRALLVVPLACLLAFQLSSVIGNVRQGERHDLEMVTVSGVSAAGGENPYTLVDGGTYLGEPWINSNLNPPITLVVFAPLADHVPTITPPVWLGISAVLYVGGLVALLRAYPDRASPLLIAWALAWGPLWSTLLHAQLDMLLFAPVVAAWLLLRHGKTIAPGILIGLIVAIKPNFAVWPVLLLFTGHFVIALVAAASFAVCGVVAAILYGPGVYLQWLTMETVTMSPGVAWPGDGSVADRAAPLDILLLRTVVAPVVLSAAIWWLWRSRPDTLTATRFALLGSLLATPIAWMECAVVTLPLLIERRWSALVTIAAVLWLLPLWILWDAGEVVEWLPAARSITAALPLVLLLVNIVSQETSGHHAHHATDQPHLGHREDVSASRSELRNRRRKRGQVPVKRKP